MTVKKTVKKKQAPLPAEPNKELKEVIQGGFTWEDALDAFSNVYVADSKLRYAATIGGATLVASKVPGDPVWNFMVGPPSTGKTIVIEAFGRDKEHCECISKLTATQLVSGWKDPSDPESDPSIFPRLRGRTLLIKDYTTIISMGGGAQEELYGILRDAYDGSVRIQYGNGKVIDVTDTYFSLLAGVTDVIKSDNRADLGERFLRCETIDSNYDRAAVAESALENSVLTRERQEQVNQMATAIQYGVSLAHQRAEAAMTLGFMPLDTAEDRRIISNLALVGGYLRTVVPRKGEELLYKPRVEGSSRMSKQLKRLGICLCFLLDNGSFNPVIHSYIRQVALDTVAGFRLDLTRILVESGRGLDSQEIANRMQLGKSNCVRLLKDMQALGMVQFRKAQNGYPGGRDAHLWFITQEFRSIWEAANLHVKQKRLG